MFRETTGADSKHAMMALHPVGGGGADFSYRDTTGGATSGTATAGLEPIYWVKLVRSGDTFTGSTAPDSSGSPGTWTERGTQSITMASTIVVGLANSSRSATVTGSATFDNVSVAASTVAPVLAASIGTTAHTENVPVVVDSGITVTDADNANMASGTVTLGAGYTAGQDVLGFTTQNGITGVVQRTDDDADRQRHQGELANSAPVGHLQQHQRRAEHRQPHHQLRGQRRHLQQQYGCQDGFGHRCQRRPGQQRARSRSRRSPVRRRCSPPATAT